VRLRMIEPWVNPRSLLADGDRKQRIATSGSNTGGEQSRATVSKLEWIDRNSDLAIRRLLNGENNFL
jgi:hypothetical protein